MGGRFVHGRVRVNLLITALGVAIFSLQSVGTGRVNAHDGLGWDGLQYARMVTGGLTDGNGSTQSRPLLPLLTRIPHSAGLDIIPAFQLMNVLYAAVLFLSLCLLLDHQGVGPPHKVYFVATVALCIATSKMFAFYPVQIDLGALAVMTAATYIVLTRTGWAGGGAALLAVTAREFGGAVALFGFHREWRQGRGLRRALLTYAPAVVVLFLLRHWARTTNLGDQRRPLATFSEIVAGYAPALDPGFIAFFLYFMVTLLGGVTLLLILNARTASRLLTTEPELATFSVPILALAAVGPDIWRYGVFLLPALAIFFAAYIRAQRPRPTVLAAALVFTGVTQAPFMPMDVGRYFRDWFPVYLYRMNDFSNDFWSVWSVRFVVTALLAAAIGILQWAALRRRSSRTAARV